MTPSQGWQPRNWWWVRWCDHRLLWAYTLQQTELITALGERITELEQQRP